MYAAFTFHYASTLSMIVLPVQFYLSILHSTMLLLYLCSGVNSSSITVFTFHYASTLSMEAFMIYDDSVFLHSTMLLLYRIYKCSSSVQFFFYIPLCFYFIFSNTIVSLSGINFTFHYASTLSNRTVTNGVQNLVLHSTMLLLYRLLHKNAKTCMLLLHSTMLLLYRF